MLSVLNASMQKNYRFSCLSWLHDASSLAQGLNAFVCQMLGPNFKFFWASPLGDTGPSFSKWQFQLERFYHMDHFKCLDCTKVTLFARVLTTQKDSSIGGPYCPAIHRFCNETHLLTAKNIQRFSRDLLAPIRLMSSVGSALTIRKQESLLSNADRFQPTVTFFNRGQFLKNCCQNSTWGECFEHLLLFDHLTSYSVKPWIFTMQNQRQQNILHTCK
jgi:hypothetical protein